MRGLTLWLGGVGVLLAVALYIGLLQQKIDAQARHIGEVEAANAGLVLSLETLEAARQREQHSINQTAKRARNLEAHAKKLEHQLQEALRDATQLSLDSPLPLPVLDAFCLRWRAASGYSEDDTRNPTPPADAGKTHPYAPYCADWQRVSLRDVLDWTGLLLDHAGLERLDKQGLREWTGMETGMEKDMGKTNK